MNIQLTAEQKALAQCAIDAGRIHGEEEVIAEALLLWENRERFRAETIALLEVAEAQLSQGGGRVITQESMMQLAEDVKRRGRMRLEAEGAASH